MRKRTRRRDKRRPVLCPNCHREMVCMNRFESIYKLIRGFYVWYICPRRNGEDGCGHITLFEFSPQTKRLRQISDSRDYKKARRGIFVKH